MSAWQQDCDTGRGIGRHTNEGLCCVSDSACVCVADKDRTSREYLSVVSWEAPHMAAA